MDPIFDRLGRLIRSFGVDSAPARPVTPEDDDLQAAWEELESEGLGKQGSGPRPARPQQSTHGFREQNQNARPHPATPGLDPELIAAYAVLGVKTDATWEEITAAHRTLLKKHHPDRHAGHEGNMRKATAQSQKIGEAFQKIKKQLGR
ncbi:MAG: J domain-containing protein [Spirochaetales bacterium]